MYATKRTIKSASNTCNRIETWDGVEKKRPRDSLSRTKTRVCSKTGVNGDKVLEVAALRSRKEGWEATRE